MILSTGMNSLDTVKKSVEIILSNNCELTILHCVSMYPTPPNKMDLGVIAQYSKTFPEINIGLSDHSLGIHMSLAAVALGANMMKNTLRFQEIGKGLTILYQLSQMNLRILSYRVTKFLTVGRT